MTNYDDLADVEEGDEVVLRGVVESFVRIKGNPTTLVSVRVTSGITEYDFIDIPFYFLERSGKKGKSEKLTD